MSPQTAVESRIEARVSIPKGNQAVPCPDGGPFHLLGFVAVRIGSSRKNFRGWLRKSVSRYVALLTAAADTIGRTEIAHFSRGIR